MPVTCFADEVAETFESYYEEAVWLFRDRIRQNQKLIESDYAFTATHLAWDKARTNTELREVSNAMNLLAIAGTPEQQAAKEAEAQAAAEVFSKEGPKLESKIAELQSKLATLERDKRLTAKRVEETREAMAKLPNVAPGYIRKRVAAAETLLNTQGVGAELRAATARLHELKCILNIGGVFENQDRHIDALRRLCRDAITSSVQNRMMSYHYSPAWPGIKAAAETEYTEISARLPEVQAAFDTALAEIKRPLLDYFFTSQEQD